MPDISNPHDKFFKGTFSQVEIAKDFLKNYLQSDICTLLDLDKISSQKDSFIDEDLQEHFSDALFLVPLKDGHEIYVYTLFEHKSSPDRWVALQLLRYMVRIWERDTESGQLRMIIPIVIYHGKQRWNIPTEFSALFPEVRNFRAFLPNFQYLLYDLPRIPESKIVGEYKLQIMIRVMKDIFSVKLLDEIEKIVAIYAESKGDQNAEDFLKTVLLYMMAGSKVKYADLEKELKSHLQPIGAKNIMMTLAEHYKQEGRQEGRQEGWQKGTLEGLQKGQIIALEKILQSRFGKLPKEISEKIEAIDDASKLDRLLIAVIEANSLQDFKKNL